tara:strand:+ start:5061 stop:5357 length:297 start_codon:yes stop_codon:yes gene_type:complete
MSSAALTAALAFLAGLLGFLWRGYSRAMRDARGARDAALEVVRQNRARAEQEHTRTMETIDEKQAQLENADSRSLAGDFDALFGGGDPLPEDSAGDDG